MATHIDQEMSSCLSEMERLQAKMTELQETKKEQEAEQEAKTTQVEPNMAVMEKWLDVYNHNLEQKELARVSKKDYDDYIVRIRGRNTKQNPLSTTEEEERKKIMDNFRKHCILTPYGASLDYTNPENMKSIETFEPKKIGTNQRIHTLLEPSQFMFDFIEATHNLFQIQQKRIDELETKLQQIKN